MTLSKHCEWFFSLGSFSFSSSQYASRTLKYIREYEPSVDEQPKVFVSFRPTPIFGARVFSRKG